MKNSNNTLLSHITFLAVLVLFGILLFLFVRCKTTEVTKQGFSLLASLTEQKLQKLLKVSAWSFAKDSVDVSITVPRTYTVMVIGKDLSRFFTRQGGASLRTEKVGMSLDWLPVDSLNVNLHFKKIKYNGLTRNP